MRSIPAPLLVIACGALSHEIQQLKKLNGWSHLKLVCLDAKLHNRPALIAPRLRDCIARYRPDFEQIFVAYADCGSAGEIDRVLAEQGVERLPGPHCYASFAGQSNFEALSEAEPGTFYLTDFLARHFDRLVITGLKLDKHPELQEAFFGNYRRLVYLSQSPEEQVMRMAMAAAEFLGLNFEHRHCGYGELETELRAKVLAFA